MLQAIIKQGKVIAENIPAPIIMDNTVLIKVHNSCISTGTEISTVQDSGKSIVEKVIDSPEQAEKIFKKLKDEGIIPVLNKMKSAVKNYKLQSVAGRPTGYSISGIVLAVGKGITKYKVGDQVAAAGAGLANHAEYVLVPENLVMKMPAGLDFVKASTVTLGGIALQGVRRADLRLGEFCVVIGSGNLGLLTIQLLRRSGIRVIATDYDDHRLQLAQEFGVELAINPAKDDILKTVENLTGGYGVDAVIFTAATASNEPLAQAFKMCKKKGRVVLVGVAGKVVKREDMFAKELDYVISTSYGPGRYDKKYEEKGLDYPYSYVRWTENRNMEEYLRLVNSGSINLDKMISAIYPIEKVTDAYDSLNIKDKKPLLVIIDYGQIETNKLDIYTDHSRKIVTSHPAINRNTINIALVGTGGFASVMHLPNIKKLHDKFKLYAVMDMDGLKAKNVADKYSAAFATTDYADILNDPAIDLVMICTRHDSHAGLTLKALQAGKHVFVEKPLATTREDLDLITHFYENNKDNKVKPCLLVGFNRRFSRYAQEIKKHTDKRINPLFIHYRMNAGYIPLDHWVHEHGGRMVGEACHIIDLMSFFTGSSIKSINAESLTPNNNKYSAGDNKAIILKYQDGSVAAIDYFAVGSTKLPKEYMEVHFDEKSIILDDYKSLKGYGVQINELSSKTSEKGHLLELERLYDTLRGGNKELPILLEDIFQTTMYSIQI